jgi:opacity protein-like surface antigen
MKKLMTICLVAVFAVLASSAQAADDDGCTEIKDGILETSEGVVITAGKDDWGYNYQANLF